MNNTTDDRCVPLEERLRLASLGVPTPVVARRIVSDCAALSLSVALRPSRGKDARQVRDVLSLRTIKELDPARRHGWDVAGGCLAEAAWATEQLFRLGELCHDKEQGRRIVLRADRTLAALVRATRCSASVALEGSPQDRARRALALPCAELLRACRVLVEAGTVADGAGEEGALELIDLASADVEKNGAALLESSVETALSWLRDPRRASELRRSLVARPFAALWASGVLCGHKRRASTARRPRPQGELERRLRMT